MRHRQLQRDQHGGAERGDLAHVAAARDDRHQQRRARPPPALTTVCSQSSDGTCPQTLNGDGRAGLVADRAVVELAQAAVGQEREHERGQDDGERRGRTRAGHASVAPAWGRSAPSATPSSSSGEGEPTPRRNSGASASGANFAAAPSAIAAPRATPPSASRRTVSASSAATQATATSVSLEFVSSAKAVYGKAAHAQASAAPEHQAVAAGPPATAEPEQAAEQRAGRRRSRRHAPRAGRPRCRSTAIACSNGHVEQVRQRAVGVAALDVVGEARPVERVAVDDPVGADHARVADVDHVRVGHVEPDPERDQEHDADQQPRDRHVRHAAARVPPRGRRPASSTRTSRYSSTG